MVQMEASDANGDRNQDCQAIKYFWLFWLANGPFAVGVAACGK